MKRLIARIVGIGVETADMLVREVCRAIYAIVRPLPGMPA
jgi:hypothetical protein